MAAAVAVAFAAAVPRRTSIDIVMGLVSCCEWEWAASSGAEPFAFTGLCSGARARATNESSRRGVNVNVGVVAPSVASAALGAVAVAAVARVPRVRVPGARAVASLLEAGAAVRVLAVR